MTAYILRRLAISVPVLLGITLFTFLFINLAPGDPISALIPPTERHTLTPAALEAKKEELGLNRPLPIRYAIWLGQLVRGNLGYSYADRRPVTTHLRERVWPTLELSGCALGLALLVATPLGIISALRQYSIVDYVLTVLSFVALSIPGFFLALGAIYVFSLRLHLLPTSGMRTVGVPRSLGDHLEHLLLPVAILSLERVGPFMRFVRSSVLEVVQQEYVTTARAKGLSERLVILRHALRNALIPLITIVGLSLPSIFGGAVLLETIFSWPGIGMLSVAAVFQRDYTVLMGLGFASAVLILVSNLLTDICYVVVDPRIRYH
jgi:peptide/nickel transport system permease protein